MAAWPEVTAARLPHQFDRLLQQVRERGLHRDSTFQDPQAWLLGWMNTPRADLGGRCPAYFLDHPDWDLILVGLLLLAPASQGGRPQERLGLLPELRASFMTRRSVRPATA